MEFMAIEVQLELLEQRLHNAPAVVAYTWYFFEFLIDLYKYESLKPVLAYDPNNNNRNFIPAHILGAVFFPTSKDWLDRLQENEPFSLCSLQTHTKMAIVKDFFLCQLNTKVDSDQAWRYYRLWRKALQINKEEYLNDHRGLLFGIFILIDKTGVWIVGLNLLSLHLTIEL